MRNSSIHQQIRARTSDKVFSRGENYYNQGAITDAIRRGDEIEARCHGSYPEPYRVWAKLDGTDIIDTGCNCEYDWGGDCKHIVALLLTYSNHPEQFQEKQPIEDILRARSQDDLVDLIMRMMQHYPDLKDFIDIAAHSSPADGVPKVPVDTLSIRQQLNTAFNSFDYDDLYTYGRYGYYNDHPAVSKIYDIARIGDQLSAQGDYVAAATVYSTILEEFAEMDEEYYHDEEGELAMSINDVAHKLDQCLATPALRDNDDERLASLEALLGVFVWDMDFGGVGVSDQIPDIILKHVQKSDVAHLRSLVEPARDRKRNSQYGQWSLEAYDTFLLDLDIFNDVDVENVLEQLRENESYLLLANRLIQLGRIDEAMTVIHEQIRTPYERRQALEALTDYGHSDKAQQIAENILAQQYERTLAAWLLGIYETQDNKEGILRLLTQRIEAQPNISDYIKLKSVAEKLNQWETLRPEIIQNLQGHEMTLTRAYMHDGEIESAWQVFATVKSNHYDYISLAISLADASLQAMPQKAISIYKRYAQAYIDDRGRDNYKKAANLLVKAKQAHSNLGQHEEWEMLINEIREQNRNLPALKDELNKAGL